MSNVYGKSCTPNLGGVSNYYTKEEIRALLRNACRNCPSSGASSLSELSDVDIITTPPEDGQSIIYNVETEKWIPGDTDVGSLSGLSDVDVTTNPPSDNQPLVYDDYLEKWLPGVQPLSLDSLEHITANLAPGGVEDVALISPQIFNILTLYSETPAWIRVYSTSSARAADTRTSPGGTLPAAGTGLYAEVVTTESPGFISFSPIPMVSCAGSVFIRVANMDTISTEVNFVFGILAYGVYEVGG
jgi:hypothetical protein